jgi:glycosyltransferase involved in cell wall biosynthesis
MRILLFANTDWYLYNFRLPLAVALRAKGCEVVFVSPPGNYSRRLIEAGFRWIAFPMSRYGINPFLELITIIRLVRLYRRERPSLVHHFTVKCVLYGSVAARIVGATSIINSITGLGYVFSNNSVLARMLRPLLMVFYRLALRNTFIIFQNPENRDLFSRTGLLCGRGSYLVRGSGVDLAHFSPHHEGKITRSRCVLLASRLLWAKGIEEFVEAAALVQEVMPDVVFQILGAGDPENPNTIPQDVIEGWKVDIKVKFMGHQDNMPLLLRQADVAVLPSYYGEGIPRILVEAAACGLPLVASDVPGCREVVKHGINGFLVPIKDPIALAEAILILLGDDTLRAEMGVMSRKIACREFPDERVISDTLEVYRNTGLLLSNDSLPLRQNDCIENR